MLHMEISMYFNISTKSNLPKQFYGLILDRYFFLCDIISHIFQFTYNYKINNYFSEWSYALDVTLLMLNVN